MKKHIWLFVGISIFLYHTVIGQNYLCQNKKNLKKYYNEVFKVQKDNKVIIKDYKKEYFTKDIFKPLLLNTKANVFPLFFESFGNFFPVNLDILNCADHNFFEDCSLKDRNYNKYSMYHLFTEKRHRKHLIEKAKKNAALAELLAQTSFLVENENTKVSNTESTLTNANYNRCKTTKIEIEKLDKFYNVWNRLNDKLILDSLNKEIENKKIKQVLFYVHGYNVPYSLAVIQVKTLLDSLKPNKETLVIPILWTANDQKKISYNINGTVNVKDLIRIKNGLKFLSFSKRGKMIGIGLRKVINKLDSSMPIHIFAHSLGTQLATAALANTTEDLKTKLKSIDVSCNDLFCFNKSLSSENITLKNRERENYIIVKGFKENEIPKQKIITLFLSAAAIGGLSTFKKFNTTKSNTWHYTVSINESDKMLNKFLGLSRYFKATTLGVNKRGEAYATKLLFKNTNDFKLVFNKYNTNHDIFAYWLYKNYKNAAKEFLLPDTNSIKDTTRLFKKYYNNLHERVWLYYQDSSKIKDADSWKHERLKLSVHLRSWQNINTDANELKDLLFSIEKNNLYSNELLTITKSLITSINNPYILVLLERAIAESEVNSNEYLLIQKRKFVSYISDYQNLISRTNYPMYKYETQKRRPISFVSISVGNDNFRPLYKFLKPKANRFLIQPNEDRDYTGAPLIEIGTDFLSIKTRRPKKKYQSILLGFDVYTPFIQNSDTFIVDNKIVDYNPNDRPYGSFLFVGLFSKSLSKHNRFAITNTFKIGTIGGQIGEKFQAGLHRDLSFDPKARGWSTQIANGGRLGISYENKLSSLIIKSEKRPYPFFNFNLSIYAENRVGSYITDTRFGISISNKSFRQANQNLTTVRVKQASDNFLDYLAWELFADIGHTIHNSMLEGYGYFSTKKIIDPKYIPVDIHKLQRSEINKTVGKFGYRLSYTTRFATFFYKWTAFSPETKFKDINVKQPANGRTIETTTQNISKRWHHMGDIGISFNFN